MDWGEIIGAIAAFVATTILTPIFTRRWVKSGKPGINIYDVTCPQCGQLQIKKSLRQVFRGGWTCTRCGCEMDKYGNSIR